MRKYLIYILYTLIIGFASQAIVPLVYLNVNEIVLDISSNVELEIENHEENEVNEDLVKPMSNSNNSKIDNLDKSSSNLRYNPPYLSIPDVPPEV